MAAVVTRRGSAAMGVASLYMGLVEELSRPHLTRRAQYRAPVVALLLTGCAGQAAMSPREAPEAMREVPEVPAPREAPFEQVHEAATRTLPGGSSFVAPRDYWLRGSAFAELEDPKHALHVSVIEVEAASAKTALEQGWARLGRHAPARLRTEEVDRGAAGWDEIDYRFYQMPPAEERMTMASARRLGTHALVTIVEASNEAAVAHQGEIASIVASLRVPGFESEDVHDREPAWDVERARSLSEFVESTRVSLGVPGASIAVIRNGAIVFEKGFGRRAIAAKEAITADTRFRLGTMSESLASKILARVTDAGAVASTQMLATLPTLDLSAIGNIVDPTISSPPSEPPHPTLDFSGPMTGSMAATMLPGVATTVAGLGPLVASGGSGSVLGGYAPTLSLSQLTMPPAASSSSSMAAPRAASSMTSPTVIASVSSAAKATGVSQALSLAGVPPGAEAALTSELAKKAEKALRATMDTSAHDLARFAIVELAYGRRVSSSTPLAGDLRFEPRRPHVSLGSKSRYGVKLAVGDTSGVRTVLHAGGSLGALVRVIVMPDEKLGLVMMTNTNTEEANALTDATFQRLVELSFGTKDRATSLVKKAVEGTHRSAPATVGTIPNDLVQRLVGTWESPDLGTLVISPDKRKHGALFADAGEWISPLGYVEEDGASFLVPLAPETGHERLRLQGDKLLVTAGGETYTLEKARRR